MRKIISIFLLYCISLCSHAQDSRDMAKCLQLAAMSASDATTVGELRIICEQRLQAADPDAAIERSEIGVVEQRVALERYSNQNPFVLTPHRSNYVLPASYRDNISDFRDSLPSAPDKIDNVELEFQLSIKVLVWEDIINNNGHLSVAYTNRSFWQAYNSDASAPFRETNHEPEFILSFENDWEWMGIRNVANQVILNHQSNGRGEPLSRSWNRLMFNMVFERDRFAMSFKPWYRFKEHGDDDDNPDIEKYLGHFEWLGLYQWHNKTLSLMLRNNLRSDNKGAVEIGWSFPISSRVKGYIKYFNGYGESLVEYNHSVESIGIGVLISDWL
ncbi:outer membrane phospholipase A [Spongiibacter sp. IMCC21906]|uniref:phospholipase A n=1 Tax=Spongiibacter sp. IMCC21906 TaxID=1620392 RepID=UPI00062E087A|nr:phospholipase A [Spongiibacter sp. IMCC21906]AKH68945.1 outer membrane phospholipase A [Spongiibacter sp. IMCC21906]